MTDLFSTLSKFSLTMTTLLMCCLFVAICYYGNYIQSTVADLGNGRILNNLFSDLIDLEPLEFIAGHAIVNQEGCLVTYISI